MQFFWLLRYDRIFGELPGIAESGTDRALPQSDKLTDRASSDGPVMDSSSVSSPVSHTGRWLGSNLTVSENDSDTELALLVSSSGLSSRVVGWLVKSSGLINKANSAEVGD